MFPTIGKGGVGVGGAYGKGRVYEKGKYVGDTSMTQVTVGFQIGGQAYSQIVFFQDEHALDRIHQRQLRVRRRSVSGGDYRRRATRRRAPPGSSAGASASKKDAETAGDYYKGMATFTVAKGGLMYEASIGGQKFNYKGR